MLSGILLRLQPLVEVHTELPNHGKPSLSVGSKTANFHHLFQMHSS